MAISGFVGGRPLPVLIVILVSLVSSTRQVIAQADAVSLVARISPSVVSITVSDDSGEEIAEASGFVIGGGLVVSACHVLDCENERVANATVVTDGGTKHKIRAIVAHSVDFDLLILDAGIPTGKIPPLPLSGGAPSVGERILVFGSPLGLARSVSDGIVSAIRQLPGERGLRIQTDASIVGGSSGGPMTNMRGQVVGVVSGGFGETVNFAVPATQLTPLLRSRSRIPIAEWAGMYYRHEVAKGQTVAGIAARFGVSAERVRLANGLDMNDPIQAGRSLIVPVEVYRVMEGDTAGQIAAIHGIAAETVFRVNRLPSNGRIVPKQRLFLPLPHRTVYRVRRGDSLSSIARRFGTSLTEIVAQNALAGRTIRPGELLVIGLHLPE